MMEDSIEIIKIQFLKGVPVKEIQFSEIFNHLDWDSQELLINSTVLNKYNIRYPLKTEYQIAFIKHILKELESHNNEEIHDVIYEQLTVKLKEDRPDFSFKHFVLEGTEAISIKESNSFIRDGTTGLKLWPAAVALAEFILKNKDDFKYKSVLELGAGATGFVGMVVLRICEPEKIFLSDCHDSVLKTLIENVNLNLANEEVEAMEKSFVFHQRLKVKNRHEFGVLNLPWEDVDICEPDLRSCKLDVLLAADVVYDETIFEALIKCIRKLFDISKPSLVLFLSQTIRNFETFTKFCNLLHQHDFETADEQLDPPKIFNWDSSAQIKILRISKKQNCKTCL